MKKIFYALKDHFIRGFKWPFFLFFVSYLSIALIVNYTINLESGIIGKYYGQNIRILIYILFYGAAYYPVAIVYAITYRNPLILRKGFWIKSLVVITLLAFDRSFHYHVEIIRELTGASYIFWIRSFFQIKSLFTLTIPVLLLFHFFKENNSYYYGMTTKNFDWKPYAIMLAIMAPLIIIVSFEPNFYNYYPRFRTNNIPDYLAVVWAALIYETSYGLDFFSVEIVFRGFLVLGMMRFLGKGSVYPMVAIYCFYHFGKPWGEAASSIIGGYILGVISLYMRTIFGGLLIHIGIAWMMELVAGVQKYLFIQDY